MIGDTWTKHWGVNAREAEVLDDGSGGNRLRLKDGVIYTYLAIPKNTKPGKLHGQLCASGTGSLSIRLSTCVRPPATKYRPFEHEIRKEAPAITLTDAPTERRFAFDIVRHEQAYLYIGVKGEAEVHHVSAVFRAAEDQEWP